jgi:hypothetical protein
MWLILQYILYIDIDILILQFSTTMENKINSEIYIEVITNVDPY